MLASDVFLPPVVGGQAFSTLSYTGLIPGFSYTIEFTGSALGTGRYQIDASSSATPPTPTALVVGPDANLAEVLFDTRQGTKTVGTPLAPGQAFRAESIVSELAGGAVDNSLTFTLSEARDFAGAFTWVTGEGPSQRETVGFDATLMDFNGNVVLSDVFRPPVMDGQAFSTFDTVLPAGSYTFEITATSLQAGTRFPFDLASGGEAPAFVPIPDAVPGTPIPEPASIVLAGGALFALGGLRRARPIGWRPKLPAY